MKTYRSAIIGVGAPSAGAIKGGGHQIGYTRAGTSQQCPRAQLACAADINPENLAAYISAAQGDRIDLPLTDLSLDEQPLEALAKRNA